MRVVKIVTTRCQVLRLIKMHQIRFRLKLCPRTRWGAYSAPSDPLDEFKGPIFKGRIEEGRKEKRGAELKREMGRRGGKWRYRNGQRRPPIFFLSRRLCHHAAQLPWLPGNSPPPFQFPTSETSDNVSVS